MRPLGDITLAIEAAASTAPGTVRDLAVRAQVGFTAARKTASRMLDRGQLVVVLDGRPQVLAAPALVQAQRLEAPSVHDALDDLHRCFWAGGLPERAADADDFAGL